MDMELRQQYKWSAIINGIFVILFVVMAIVFHVYLGDNIALSLLSSIPGVSICGIIAILHWRKYKRLADPQSISIN